MMDVLWVNLMRFVHVFAGILWVGAAFLFLFFINPSVKATAPNGQKFLQHFIVRRKYPAFMGIVELAPMIVRSLLGPRV